MLIEFKQSFRVKMIHLHVNIVSTGAYRLIIDSYFTELQQLNHDTVVPNIKLLLK